MDKKNTMLLTVIAVATLLVAVVGATFAYFSVTGANTTTTTGVEVAAEEAGVVALSGGEELHITLSAADMASSKQGTAYYATNVADEAYKPAATPYTVATATVEGGETTTKYKCTFTLTATVGGDMTLTAGDASLVLLGAVSDTYDLVGGTKTYTVTMDQLTGTNTTQNVQAYVVFNNTAVDQTANVAGKTLTVDLASTDFACDTVA